MHCERIGLGKKTEVNKMAIAKSRKAGALPIWKEREVKEEMAGGLEKGQGLK